MASNMGKPQAPERVHSAGLISDMSSGLNLSSRCFVEYVWLGGSGQAGDIRTYTRVLSSAPGSFDSTPHLELLASEAGMSADQSAVVLLQPRVMFADPFRQGSHVMVLCDPLVPEQLDAHGTVVAPSRPHEQNNRAACVEITERASARRPWITFDQEYTLIDPATEWPLGWPAHGTPRSMPGTAQGQTPASFLASKGRDVAELHARFCVHAGVNIAKFGPTDVPGVWKFQVGPGEGTSAADHLWMARFLMSRVCESLGALVSWDPKPVPGDWPGCGCRVRFSTTETRVAGNGWFEMERQLQRLQQLEKHRMHIQAYGIGLERRTGPVVGEIPPIWTVGEGQESPLYIPTKALKRRGGYWVDARPGASVDPYIAALLLVSTALDLPLADGDKDASGGAGGTLHTIGENTMHRFGAINTGWLNGSAHGGSQYEGSALVHQNLNGTANLNGSWHGGGMAPYGMWNGNGSAHGGRYAADLGLRVDNIHVGGRVGQSYRPPSAQEPETSHNSTHVGRRRATDVKLSASHDGALPRHEKLGGSVPEALQRGYHGLAHLDEEARERGWAGRFAADDVEVEGTSSKRGRYDMGGRVASGNGAGGFRAGVGGAGVADPALYQWEPGTGEGGGGGPPRTKSPMNGEMSDTSPDSIADMMARDDEDGNVEDSNA